MTSFPTLSRQDWQTLGDAWLQEVDSIFLRRTGRSVFALGDFGLADMFLDGDTPTWAARKVLRQASEAGVL